MKNLIHTVFLVIGATFLSMDTISAQTGTTPPPEGIIYQAEARDQSGKLLTNKMLEVKLIITQDSPDGSIVWEGIYTVYTDKYGLFGLTIGESERPPYSFNNIHWDQYRHFLTVQLMNEGVWETTSETEFLTVPYAFHAKTATTALSTTESDPVWTEDQDNYYTIGQLQSAGGSFIHWNNLTNKPTTVAGYGIVDGASLILNQTFTGENVFAGSIFVPTPTEGGQAANKSYVDAQVEAMSLQIAALQSRIQTLETAIENLTTADFDQDGFSAQEGDCNDYNPEINPNAAEICDGIDNNCNGDIDEGCFEDNDQDGFSPAEGDCDDADGSVNPGAVEICGDGIDQDCDGEDEACPSASIAAVREALDGSNITIDVNSVYVTYVLESGFTLQADPLGPALFVSGASSSVAQGDMISLTVTQKNTVQGMCQVTSYTDLNTISTGNDIAGLVQDITDNPFLVSDLNEYESELITATGTVLGPFSFSGAGYMAAQFATVAIVGDPNLQIRVPDNLTYLLPPGTEVTISASPLWRFDQRVQVSAWNVNEITILSYPDLDGDTYTADVDCDDSDPEINPGAIDVCDGIDNDCNGVPDDGIDPIDYPNGYVVCNNGSLSYECQDGFADCDGNPENGCEVDLNTDAQHCGSCGNDCQPGYICVSGQCVEVVNNSDDDQDNWTVAQGDCNDSDPNINPAAEDLPDENNIDSNCDGIDGNASLAVFVSKAGNDLNDGSMESPKLTINAAVNEAMSSGKTQVLISVGTYPEKVIIMNGISIFGGYAADWTRSSVTNVQVIGSVDSKYSSALEAANITTTTYINRIQFSAPNASGTFNGQGKSSYAMILNNAGALIVSECALESGQGSNGMNGIAGVNGSDGSNGSNGRLGSADSEVTASGGPGGSSNCSRYGGRGGSGGYAGNSGSDGEAGWLSTPGGTGGSSGDPGRSGSVGNNGTNGSNGTNGQGGSGGIIDLTLPDVIWVGDNGENGINGQSGNGGGGGGGGGGQDMPLTIWDGTGNGGGGGGAGGCAGTAGTGGSAGGGSFAMCVLNSNGLTIANCLIQSSSGGAGGHGGSAGIGGTGGAGGAGGTGFTNEVGAGGNGGDGGDGGRGGHGGGGAGGPSIGIITFNSSIIESGNNISLGTGGLGGNSAGSAGVNGTAQPRWNL